MSLPVSLTRVNSFHYYKPEGRNSMKILHLYHDLMNLYGDYANVLALQKLLNNNGIETVIDKLSVSDSAKLSDYDFIYIGSGTERNQKLVLEDLRKYKDELKKCIDNGKVILMTGNSFEMLGKSITDCSENKYDGLGIFVFETSEQNKTRITADAILKTDMSDKKLVGFINKCSSITKVDTPLFAVKMGIGNSDNDKSEGVRKNNFFGTHLTGPILIKNPYFLECIASLVVGKDKKLNTDYLTYEKAGYEVTLSELKKRMENEN